MEANKSINRSDTQKNLYNALVESYNSDKDIITSYGDVILLKRGRDDQDKDEDPFARSDRGTKRMKYGKDAESYKDSRSKEKKSSSTFKDASKSQHKSFGKSVHGDEPIHTVEESGMQQGQEFITGDNDEQPIDKELKIPNLTQETLVGRAFNLLKDTCKSITELEYHFEECSKETAKRLDWHKPENKLYPFDLRKPFLLIQDHRGHQIIPKDYFSNKDLEYLKGGDSSRRYSTSVMKTKAATYELKWIEDLFPEFWSPVVVNYDQHAYFGTSHWVPNAKASTDMQVKDLQLGVKSYQKKLNLTKPDTYRSNLRNKIAYNSRSNPHGIIYVDLFKRKRLMRTDELHKFSDGTLNNVQTALYDIVAGIRMKYLPMRK
uniref:Uncharacterized protein n=1 Tax=Tanacetum cinerariifolium TaxID=118510 RepID=A0A699I6P4_TANCI|nr:hypothetical protein [Tanacetum cinerariifolium]